MGKLSHNWITEKLIDFEYKKYILLAYLKEVSDNFDLNKLYPYLAELIEHYKQAVAIKENKQNLLNAFPQRLKKIDAENLEMIYQKMMEDDSLMKEIEEILNFSIPQFQHYLAEGKKIYDFIEEHMHVSPIGLIPLNNEHGYMLLKRSSTADTDAYQYNITIFNQPDEKYRAIHTQFIRTYRHSLTNSFESIKTSLLLENKNLPNPATYAIESEIAVPLEETFLPIAKRVLVKYVAGAASA
jgi:hypothetical protein